MKNLLYTFRNVYLLMCFGTSTPMQKCGIPLKFKPARNPKNKICRGVQSTKKMHKYSPF